MNFKKFISGVGALAIAASAFAGMAVTANAATNNLYVVSTWTEEAAKDFNSAMNVDTTNNMAYVDSNSTYRYEKTFNVTNNSKVTYDIDWVFGTATGRTNNYNYIQIGSKLRLGYNSSYNLFVSTDAGDSYTQVDGHYLYNNTYTKKVHVVYDSSTQKIESATFDNVSLGLDDTQITGFGPGSISIGFTRGGSVGWTLRNGFKAVSITEETQTVQTADYTINYKYGGETLLSVPGNLAVGATVNATLPITIGDQKYYAADGATTSKTLVADSTQNELNVDLRLPNSYTVKTINGETVFASTSVTEGEDAYLAYPRFVLSGTTLSETPQGDSSIGYYRHKFTNVSANDEYPVPYTAKEGICVYYREAEELEGVVTSTGNAADIRCSCGAGASLANNVAITSLPAGKYKIYTNVWGTSGGTYTISAGTRAVLEATTNGNYTVRNSDEFVLDRSTALTLNITGGNANRVLDYIYIMKTGEAVEGGTTVKSFAFDTFTADSVAGKSLRIKVGDNNWTAPVALSTTNFNGTGDVAIAIIISGIPENVAVSARID